MADDRGGGSSSSGGGGGGGGSSGDRLEEVEAALRETKTTLALALVAALTIWAPAPRAGLKHNFVLRAMYRYFSFRVVFAPENKFVADRPYVWIATDNLPGMQVLSTAPCSCVWIATDDLPGMQVLTTALSASKLGISAGIRNRMRIEVQSSAGKEKVEKELKEAEKVMDADYH